jgi:hypothetical protein
VNGADHQHRQQTPQTYLNQVNVHKHHTPQHTVPVQSAYLSSPPNSRNGLSPSSTNIYHFSQHNSQQVKFFFSRNVLYLFILDSNIFRWRRRSIKTSSSTTSRCDCNNLSLIHSRRFDFVREEL